jgi:hypothetical protein
MATGTVREVTFRYRKGGVGTPHLEGLAPQTVEVIAASDNYDVINSILTSNGFTPGAGQVGAQREILHVGNNRDMESTASSGYPWQVTWHYEKNGQFLQAYGEKQGLVIAPLQGAGGNQESRPDINAILTGIGNLFPTPAGASIVTTFATMAGKSLIYR